MLQLIKADLTGILTLFAEYRPQLDRESLALDIRKLERLEDRDYLFLARREKSYLFPISEVYRVESYAYLCWTAYTLFSTPQVDALYLHVSRVVHGHPFGIVTVLDYAASARDVERYAAPTKLPKSTMGEEIKKEKVTPKGSPALVKPINSGIEEQEQNGVTVPSKAEMIFARIP